MKRALLILFAIVTAGCVGFYAGENKENIKGILRIKGSSSSLARIFTPEMVGVQRTYLETLTGPAKYIKQREDGITDYTYSFQSCNVTAYETNKKIEGYSLEVTEHCSPSLSEFYPELSLQAYKLTMKDIEKATGGKPASDCLAECGNSQMSYIGIIGPGPHSADWIHVEAFSPIDGEAVNAASQWIESMPKGENGSPSSYVTDGKFNCETKYDKAGLEAMSSLPVRYISIGRVLSDIGYRATGSCN